jgi:hypothetical protein
MNDRAGMPQPEISKEKMENRRIVFFKKVGEWE